VDEVELVERRVGERLEAGEGDEALATNNALLAIQTFGEGWHQNHHAFPSSAYFDFEWWQIDLGAWLIRALAAVGGIKNVKQPSKEAIAARRAEPDEEDWWADVKGRTAPSRR
jgi:hypothetical protein